MTLFHDKFFFHELGLPWDTVIQRAPAWLPLRTAEAG